MTVWCVLYCALHGGIFDWCVRAREPDKDRKRKGKLTSSALNSLNENNVNICWRETASNEWVNERERERDFGLLFAHIRLNWKIKLNRNTVAQINWIETMNICCLHSARSFSSRYLLLTKQQNALDSCEILSFGFLLDSRAENSLSLSLSYSCLWGLGCISDL